MTADAPAPIERPGCPTCAEPAAAARPLGVLGHRRLVRCRRCGLDYAHTFDRAALREHYAAAYYGAADDPRLPRWRATHEDVWEGLCRSLERACGGGVARLLDVGVGSGGFLAYLAARHPATALEGVEPDPSARAAVADLLPRAQLHARLDEVRGPFDAVTLLNTLEHVEAPLAVCRAIHRVLVPSGVLLLTVPNAAALAARARGLRAPCYANDTHLQFFTAAAVRRTLTSAGFEQVRRVVAPPGGGGVTNPVARAAQWLLRAAGRANELRFAARR
ncbi:MAG: class I SAM-dependent methyltransferase [Planctomycetota bacterium]